MKRKILFLLSLMVLLFCSTTYALTKVTQEVDGETRTFWTTNAEAERIRKEEAEKQALKQATAQQYKDAQKRSENDPIYVALFRTTVSEAYKNSLRSDKVFDRIKQGLDEDPIIKLIDQGKVDKAQEDISYNKTVHSESFKRKIYLNADVFVYSNITIEKKVGINKKTKKLAEVPFLVIEGRAKSGYLSEDDFKFSESDTIFLYKNATDNFIVKLIQLIKYKIGPNIPAHNNTINKASSEEEIEVDELIDKVSDVFKLFKKEK